MTVRSFVLTLVRLDGKTRVHVDEQKTRTLFLKEPFVFAIGKCLRFVHTSIVVTNAITKSEHSFVHNFVTIVEKAILELFAWK
jgi:hypothetical protein